MSLSLGTDELVLLVKPGHPLAGRKQITMEEMGRQTVIAHNDPSPARDRVLRLYEQRHAPLNIRISLPSLDGIKRAVEMGLGVALLPRRCATTARSRAVSWSKCACRNCGRRGNCASSIAATAISRTRRRRSWSRSGGLAKKVQLLPRPRHEGSGGSEDREEQLSGFQILRTRFLHCLHLLHVSCHVEKSRKVRNARSRFPHVLVVLEQQPRRVPLARQQRVSCRVRHRRPRTCDRRRPLLGWNVDQRRPRRRVSLDRQPQRLGVVLATR